MIRLYRSTVQFPAMVLVTFALVTNASATN